MTNRQNAMAATIEALLAAGFEPAGTTPQETIKIMVNSGHGYPGHKGVHLGGRQRFVKPGTDIRATVGKVTTTFYRVINGNTVYLKNVPTKDTAGVAEFATTNGGLK